MGAATVTPGRTTSVRAVAHTPGARHATLHHTAMLLVVRLFLLRWLAARTLGGVVAAILTAALPAAAVLKVVGLPVLAVAGVIGVPVAGLMALLGLPLVLVLGVAGVVVAVAAVAALLGLVALKFVLPALLVGWLVRWIVGQVRARREPVVAGPVAESPIV